MALYQVNAGDRILAVDNTQFYNILKGVAASGESITLIYNAAGSVILQPSSDPAAGTELIQIKNNAGTVQSALSSDGKFYAGDGSAALPGITYENDKDTGFYRVGANEIGLTLGGVIKVDFLSSLITIVPPVSLSSTLAFSTAASRIIPGATSFSIRNNGDSADNLLVSDAGVVTVRGSLTVPSASFISFGAFNTLYNDGTSAIIRGGNTATNSLQLTGSNAVLNGTLTAGGLTTTALQIASTGPLIYSGSGAPSISAAVKGSLYLRSDGTTTNDRAYIATNTSGTWTALTTAA